MNEKRRENVRLQLQATQAWVAYWQTYISSGAYKSRKLERPEGSNPDGSFKWRACTDEEKLATSMGSLHAHVERVQELTDLLMEDSTA